MRAEDAKKRTRRDIDITRYYASHATDTIRYYDAFKEYAVERVLGADPDADAVPTGQGQRWDGSQIRQLRIDPAILRDIATKLDLKPETLRSWVEVYLRGGREEWENSGTELTPEERAEFRAWEQLRAFEQVIAPVRAFVAIMLAAPAETREPVELAYAALDDEMRDLMRPALDAHLQAAEFIDEGRRLHASSERDALAVYDQHRARLLGEHEGDTTDHEHHARAEAA